MKIVSLLLDIIAVYRITKLIIDDEILADFRDLVWDKFPPESTKIGYLITCPWCTSIWAGIAVFALRKLDPNFTDYLSSVLAASAVTGVVYTHVG